jgi:hypothetical protein
MTTVKRVQVIRFAQRLAEEEVEQTVRLVFYR